jgi:hypothetical protein
VSWLIDKSALVRLAASPDAADWAGRIEGGLVRITTVTRLEIGCSARSGEWWYWFCWAERFVAVHAPEAEADAIVMAFPACLRDVRAFVRHVTLRPESPLPDGEYYPHRLRNSWVMPATTAVASTQPRMIISQA